MDTGICEMKTGKMLHPGMEYPGITHLPPWPSTLAVFVSVLPTLLGAGMNVPCALLMALHPAQMAEGMEAVAVKAAPKNK